MATVVITGGNRGIGLELARLYAASGDTLILGVRRPQDAGAPGEILPLDVGGDHSVAAFAKALNERPIDILINNAGVIGPDRQSALNTDFAGFLDALNINTLGPLRVTQALLPNLRKSRNAKIAIISSRMGSLSYAKSDRAAYRASKAAVNKLAQCLATDLAEEGIAVAALHPGWVRTDMGGPSADISVEDSARGLKAVIDGLSMAQSGQFLSYDGSHLAW
jgi:NAD(P)-dependent dehydrogenase (short-subunit alcohol dehydrogenase family)